MTLKIDYEPNLAEETILSLKETFEKENDLDSQAVKIFVCKEPISIEIRY